MLKWNNLLDLLRQRYLRMSLFVLGKRNVQSTSRPLPRQPYDKIHDSHEKSLNLLFTDLPESKILTESLIIFCRWNLVCKIGQDEEMS